MPTKERYQNPVVGDTLRLRLFFYNSNNFADVNQIQEVKIYKVADGASMNDVSARTLVQTVTSASIVNSDTGQYYIDIEVSENTYTIGNYVDVWTVNFNNQFDEISDVTNPFTVYPNLWYTTPIPVVYDFNFAFRPSKLRKGSKRYLIIEVTPNVPKGTDLQRYYENLAIVGNMKVSIEQRTGDCLPQETDLRLLVDKADVTYREKKFGYYMLDTTDMEVAIYDVWFELDLGENTYISEKYQIQIFD
jgi:hypothetical protein